MVKTLWRGAGLSLGLLAASVAGQPVALVLDQEDMARMTPEARAHFETASRSVFQNPEVAFAELQRAAELSPGIADLQFLLADFAVSMTLYSASPEARVYSQAILDSAERFIANPDSDARRLRRMSNFLSLYHVPDWGTRRGSRMTPGLTEESNRRIGEILDQIRARLDELAVEASAEAQQPELPAPLSQ